MDDSEPTSDNPAAHTHFAAGRQSQRADIPLMTRSDALGNASCPNLGVAGRDKTSCSLRAEDDFGGDRHDIVLILAFLRHEIEQSASILGDLAGRICEALGTLATAVEHGNHQLILSDAAIALQNEDRVQQRLCDLAVALSVLERTLAGAGASNAGIGLNQAIFESLRLEETRRTFATGVSLADAFHQSTTMAEAPSVGDIDLF